MNKKISNSISKLNKTITNIIFRLSISLFFIILLIFCSHLSPLIFLHIIIISFSLILFGIILNTLDKIQEKFIILKNHIKKKNITNADNYYQTNNFITTYSNQVYLRTPSIISTLILYFSFLHIMLLVTGSKANYKEVILPQTNNYIQSLQIAHLPDSNNINTFFLRNFWKHNQLLPTYNNGNYIFNTVFDYSFVGIFFIGFIGEEYNNDNLHYIFQDKSLIDTVKVKYNNNSTNCFLKSDKINPYFINNEFILEIKDNKMIFKSLYLPPMDNDTLYSQLLLILTTCE